MSTGVVRSSAIPTLGEHLVLIARRTYRILNSGHLDPAGEATTPVETPLEAEELFAPGLEHADAFAAAAPFTDVLVAGSAYALPGSSSVDVAVEVGPARKLVRVHGDRRVELDAAGRIRFSVAESFASMTLTWTRAYGGRDREAERLPPAEGKLDLAEVLARMPGVACFSYPRNPTGTGFFIDVDRERLSGARVPNFEDPRDPVTPERLLARDPLDWIDRPAAAGFGPIGATMFPRSAFCFPPEFRSPQRPVYELACGALTEADLDREPFAPADLRLYQLAPPGLGTHRLNGNERVHLWNLHPKHAFLEFDLPADRPRLFLEPTNAGMRELDAKLATVLIEPDEGRVTLTWAGSLRVAASYPRELTAVMPRNVLWARGGTT